MKLSWQKSIEAIDNYINGNVTYPFFVVADNSADIAKIIDLLPSDFKTVYTSDYCLEDSYPDYDRLDSELLALNSNVLLLGLGECSLFSLNYGFCGKLKDMPRSFKTVVIARGASGKCANLQQLDSKFGNLRWCEVDSALDISVVKVSPSVKIVAAKGFKALIRAFETNKSGKHYVHTDLDLANSAYIRNSYGALRDKDHLFTVPEKCLTSSRWDEYLSDSKLSGYPLTHWRTYLNMWLLGVDSPYLSLVMRHSPTYDDYKTNLLSAILSVDHTSPKYRDYYEERKALLKSWPEHELLSYVLATKARDKTRIYYLTDSTKVERRAIVEELAHIGKIPEELHIIYPDLALYLKLYRFSGDNADFFTNYFERYKQQKAINKIFENFLKQVKDISTPGERKYNSLPSRNSLLLQLTKPGTGLYWMDALGVEFLAYIQQKAKELGLVIKVSIARATLPTLTSINRGFFDDWEGFKFQKDPHLDKLKHEGTGDVGIKSTDPAVHLADELNVITDALVKIKVALTNHEVEKVLLVSDHGASRLCVLNQHENKWEMSEKGKHSGRCCKVSEIDEKPESATESQEYWVLANYDRFKGGMPANVEVHGGATLEEVIVPLVELSLESYKVECSLIGKSEDNISSVQKPLDGYAVLEVYCSNAKAELFIRIRGKDYPGVQNATNKNKFSIILSGQFLVGTIYEATFFDGDNELNTVRFTLNREKGVPKKKNDGTEFFK
jgi:hypothetical protein